MPLLLHHSKFKNYALYINKYYLIYSFKVKHTFKVLVQGNLAWNEAITISENVHKNIKWKPLSEHEMPEVNNNLFYIFAVKQIKTA